MTTTLKDFLREESAKREALLTANKSVIEEWRDGIERLFQQLQEWLAENDPGQVIQIRTLQKTISEPGLGEYSVPILDLHILGKWIAILPKARRTVGSAHPPKKQHPERATGRVDITDEGRRYILYRFPNGDQDLWMIDDLRSEPKVLDRATFEAALMSYLQ